MGSEPYVHRARSVTGVSRNSKYHPIAGDGQIVPLESAAGSPALILFMDKKLTLGTQNQLFSPWREPGSPILTTRTALQAKCLTCIENWATNNHRRDIPHDFREEGTGGL
jgi:hypothetical protein